MKTVLSQLYNANVAKSTLYAQCMIDSQIR